MIVANLFQSTHPAWGGTRQGALTLNAPIFQSTHPAWGGTLEQLSKGGVTNISIHPPRVGWDVSKHG